MLNRGFVDDLATGVGGIALAAQGVQHDNPIGGDRGLSCPTLLRFSKLAGFPHQHYHRLSRNPGDEPVLLGQLLLEGCFSHDHWIHFAAQLGRADEAGLDDASLTAVPLPAAAWLLLSGLVGLGAVGRRRASAMA